MDTPLEQLRRIIDRVADGERLSDAERDALRSAAAEEPVALEVRLAWAHALSNAEQDREALEQFDRLARERPAEVRVQLGRARALAGLERYAEAEAALEQSLRLNPGDPEAHKALAALALRRGEPRQAQQQLSQALARDPFDPEAKLLREELRSAELGASPANWLLALVRPVLRPSSFSARAPHSLHQPGPAGLLVYYVLHHATLLRYLPVALPSSVGVSLQEVDRAAWSNLDARPARLVAVELRGAEVALSDDPGAAIWAFAGGDGYDGARLLCPSHARALRDRLGSGELEVCLGRREWTLACRAGYPQAAALRALPAEPDGIPGTFLLRGPQLVPVP